MQSAKPPQGQAARQSDSLEGRDVNILGDVDILGGDIPAGEAPASRRETPGVRNAKSFKIRKDAEYQVAIPDEPPRIVVEDFRAFLMSCVMAGASDVTVQTDRQPRAEINGQLYRVTRRSWSGSEVDMVLMETFGQSNARSEINALKVLDYSYELNLPDGGRQRFRVNATGIYSRSGSGVEITLRSLPSKTPDQKMVQLSDTLLEAMTPRDGIVVVAGATGQGKSTTLAAVIRHLLEAAVRPFKIVDIQAPIEYTYADVTQELSGSGSTIGQSEVGRHILSFAAGVHSALRRKPHIINIGEARDLETISAALEAALTGHLVYTTTHAGSIVDTIRRLLSTFPADEREARAFDLAASLRVIVVQYLVPRADKPGRVPVREFICIGDDLRKRMLNSEPSTWPAILLDEMSKPAINGDREALTTHAIRLFKEGALFKEDFQRLTGLSASDILEEDA